MLLIAILYALWPAFLLGAVAAATAAWFVRGVARAFTLGLACLLGLGACGGGMI